MILANIRKNTMLRPVFLKVAPLLAFFPVLVSTYLLPSPIIGALALLLYLAALGQAFGSRLAPRVLPLLRLSVGTLAGLAVLSLLGSAVYYSSTMTTGSLLAVLAATSILASSIATTPVENNSTPRKYGVVELSICVLGASGLAAWWLAITNISITEPVRSPWLVLDPFVLVAIGIAIVSSLLLLSKERTRMLGGLMLAATIFSATALAAVVYPYGYGFDPFLHRATVLHIAEHGTITPKPLYYIGQYALELIAIKLFALPLFLVDVFLAPLLAAFGIVAALAARQSVTKASSMVLASLIFLPLAAFVQTTPQALAFIFTAWTIFVPPRPRLLPAILALTAAIIHPLAGLAAVIYVALLLLNDLKDRYGTLGTVLMAITTALAAIVIPLAFMAQAKISHLPLEFSLSNLLQLQNLPLEGFLGTHFNAWGDLAYIFISNSFLVVLVLAGVGIWLTPKNQKGWYVPMLVAGAMLVNFIILSLGFNFSFLITYERLDFALRLLTLAILFLIPYVAIALAAIWKRVGSGPFGLRPGTIGLLALVFVTNVYAAYPRHDNYARSSGFNLGPSDLETVHLIDTAAGGQPYIVLSDQALAAAAVQEFGFRTYYKNDIFFYPIPTGGPLYQHFLSMVEDQPNTATIDQALDLAGVDLAFFAVHNYWWQAPQIVENTKALTSDWFAVDNGSVTVFIFRRPEAES